MGDISRMKFLRQRFAGLIQNPLLRSGIYNGSLILLWYTLSTTLGLYNKKLVGKDQGIYGKGAFPAPLFMSAVQFALQAMLAKIVFGLGIIERRGKPITWHEYARVVLPNGITTGLDIGFSNKSLVYITMSFYTMCKSTVPIFLLVFAFIWKIERPSWGLAGVVLVITSGLTLLVKGEVDFDPLGFSLVMVASLLSGLRFTLTQVLLHGHEDSVAIGGPLEVLEHLTPVMSIVVFMLSLFWERLWETIPASPYFQTLEHTGATLLIILAGALLAFLMVWTEYKVIKETSALTFMVAGTCKEVVTVIAAVIVMGDRFGPINGIGLGIVIFGVVLFNVYKYRKMSQGDWGTLHRSLSRNSKDRDAESSLEMEPLVVASKSTYESPTSSNVPARTISRDDAEYEPLVATPGIMVHR